MTTALGVQFPSVRTVASESIACLDHGRPGSARKDDEEPLAAAMRSPSAELLRTIAGVLDIRAVFPRVSAIAKRVLRHDCLELMCHDHGDHFRLEARCPDEFREDRRRRIRGDAEFDIVRDLRESSRWAVGCDPDFVSRLLAAGYRSLLSVRNVTLDQGMWVSFFSKQPDAYSPENVAAAQLILEHIAVAVAHQQLAKAESERAAARRGNERIDARVRAVSDGAGATTGHVRPIGRSAAFRDVLARALQVAGTETTVFLQGESGTGKEVIARFIHQASPRKDGPFVAINCAALPEQLLESELFGYERGAFTGAHQAKPGQIELAARGVLFLDEVSEMSPTAQAKFLRFLQEREFQRLGSTRLLRANVRVIAASNRDLGAEVASGRFREDLFYRLQVFDILLPPLRERASDIPLFADAFLRDLGRSLARPVAGLTAEARAALMAHGWPGNVRELHNVLERATILCEEGLIARQHLALRASARGTRTDLAAAERRTIEQVLRETDGNKAKAARRVGLTRTQLYVRLRKYGLDTPENGTVAGVSPEASHSSPDRASGFKAAYT